MKSSEVKVGGVYTAKVTDKVVPVRIDAVNTTGGGGWDGTNMHTNRKVRIKSAAKLRSEVKQEQPAEPKRARKKLTTEERKARNAEPKSNAAGNDKSDAKPTTKAKAQSEPKEKKLSLIDAAAQVLGESDTPLNTKQMIELVTEQNLWSTTTGKTPHATLYSAILREMQNKGDDARFKKVERGQFTLAKGA